MARISLLYRANQLVLMSLGNTKDFCLRPINKLFLFDKLQN